MEAMTPRDDEKEGLARRLERDLKESMTASPLSALSGSRADVCEGEEYFYLNGYRKKWRSFSHFNGRSVSYDDVVEWSGINSDSNIIRERIYTVTYAMPHGSKLRDGSLSIGKSVSFESGMVFNVTRTNRA